MAAKDLILPGALIGAGALIIYQYTKGQHAASKLSLAESAGRELPPPPPEGEGDPSYWSNVRPWTPGTPIPGAGGSGGPGLSGLNPRQQANLLMHYRAGDITARQYLNAGGCYAALRRAEDMMSDGYMVPQPIYGPPVV